MINPAMVVSPSGQPGTNNTAADALNGAYSGSYASLDPNAQGPMPQYLGATAIPSLSQGPTVVSPSMVSPQIFGVGGPVTILGTPDSSQLGPASAISGQATAGDSGVMSGMGVGQTVAPSDASTAPAPAAATPMGGS